MRLGFLFGYIVTMWALIIIGSFILIKVIAPIELDAGVFVTSLFKAIIALSMVVTWLVILVVIKNYYTRRKLITRN
ncbi:MAG: hypothetical protein EX285_01350 [Thaumarchaeota archaeon]|mgnify:FL=1|nr:hypothetical protein [Nitrososphaerota archaeon]